MCSGSALSVSLLGRHNTANEQERKMINFELSTHEYLKRAFYLQTGRLLNYYVFPGYFKKQPCYFENGCNLVEVQAKPLFKQQSRSCCTRHFFMVCNAIPL